MAIKDYCLYPNLCGIGADCSECHQRLIQSLRSELAAEREGHERVYKAMRGCWKDEEKRADRAEAAYISISAAARKLLDAMTDDTPMPDDIMLSVDDAMADLEHELSTEQEPADAR